MVQLIVRNLKPTVPTSYSYDLLVIGDVLSKHLDGRSGKQCRERYFNILDPNVKRGHWTIEEDHLIIELHNAIGNKWAEVTLRSTPTITV
jgi:hypothetical protein